MAKYSDPGYPAADALDGTEFWALVQDALSKIVTADLVKAFVLAGFSANGLTLTATNYAGMRTALGLGSAYALDLDTDGTLAANSDAKVATQKAVKTFVATAVAGLLDLKGDLDCSANPNYPAALKGDAYYVTVAGKIGGGSGETVDVGDTIIASADNAGGTEASVGTSWFVLEHNLIAALAAAICSTTEQLTGTDAAKVCSPDSVAALWEQGADVASSGTVSLGEGGYFNITGTTTITDIDFATDKAGRKAWVKFGGVLTLTHSGSTLILPTGANIVTAAGDTAEFVSEGSDVVRCVSYQRASGAALTVSEATSADVWTGSSSSKVMTPKKVLDAAVPQALTDAGTVTPDFNAGFNFEWTIGGNRTLANPSNTKSGQSGTIKIVQDATGSRIISYGNNWRFPGGSATGGLLSTAANAIDIIAYTVGTDGKLYATLAKAFAA